MQTKTLAMVVSLVASLILASRYEVQGVVGVVSGLASGFSALWLLMNFVDSSSKD